MKKATSTILFILILSIAGCGSKKKEDKQLENLTNNQTRNQNTENSSQNQEILESQASEELMYSLRASTLNIERIKKGSPVFIQCSTFKSVQEINLCRIGFSNREVQVGRTIISTGRSEDLYNSIYDENVKEMLMDGEMLSIKCEKKCKIAPILKRNNQEIGGF
jgi:hypothetical protein